MVLGYSGIEKWAHGKFPKNIYFVFGIHHLENLERKEEEWPMLSERNKIKSEDNTPEVFETVFSRLGLYHT